VVRFWIDFTSNQSDYLQARSEAIIRLKRAFDENGITIPFPTRTLDFAPREAETLFPSREAAVPQSESGTVAKHN